MRTSTWAGSRSWDGFRVFQPRAPRRGERRSDAGAAGPGAHPEVAGAPLRRRAPGRSEILGVPGDWSGPDAAALYLGRVSSAAADQRPVRHSLRDALEPAG